MDQYLDALYHSTFMAREYFYGDRPIAYLENQLRNIGDDPQHVFLSLLGFEARLKEQFGRDMYIKFRETELIYTHDKFILSLKLWNLQDDLKKHKVNLYRMIGSDKWIFLEEE